MKSVANKILVVRAEIAALRFLRSGAASAALAHEAILREEARESELQELESQLEQPELEFDPDETPLAMAASMQHGKGGAR